MEPQLQLFRQLVIDGRFFININCFHFDEIADQAANVIRAVCGEILSVAPQLFSRVNDAKK